MSSDHIGLGLRVQTVAHGSVFLPVVGPPGLLGPPRRNTGGNRGHRAASGFPDELVTERPGGSARRPWSSASGRGMEQAARGGTRGASRGTGTAAPGLRPGRANRGGTLGVLCRRSQHTGVEVPCAERLKKSLRAFLCGGNTEVQ